VTDDRRDPTTGQVHGDKRPPPERRCIAHLKTEPEDRDSTVPKGEQCPNWGVKGTDPPICRLHGGGAFINDGRKWVHHREPTVDRDPVIHRYSVLMRDLPRLQAAAEQLESDPDVLDTQGEILLLRSMLVAYVKRYGEPSLLTAENFSYVSEQVERISRLVERRHKQLNGPGLQITIRDWMALVDRFMGIAEEYFALQDPERWGRFLNSVAHLLRPSSRGAPQPALDAAVEGEYVEVTGDDQADS
jgi:hypothetical protein